MNWTDRYVGMKYQAGKFDCAELCRLVIHEHFDVDIILPSEYDWRKTSAHEVKQHLRDHISWMFGLKGIIHGEPPPIEVSEFDLVVMENYSLGGSHVGLVAPDVQVLHCIKTHGTILTPWDTLARLRLHPTMVCRWAYPYPRTQSAQTAQ